MCVCVCVCACARINIPYSSHGCFYHTHRHATVPTLTNAMQYMEEGRWNWVGILERVIKLSIPNLIMFSVGFYALFHSYLVRRWACVCLWWCVCSCLFSCMCASSSVCAEHHRRAAPVRGPRVLQGLVEFCQHPRVLEPLEPGARLLSCVVYDMTSYKCTHIFSSVTL